MKYTESSLLLFVKAAYVGVLLLAIYRTYCYDAPYMDALILLVLLPVVILFKQKRK